MTVGFVDEELCIEYYTGNIRVSGHRIWRGAGLGTAALTALALLGNSAVQAADAGMEERFKNIERQLEVLQKENAELKSQLKGDSAKGGAAGVKAAGKENKITLGGMIQTQFEVGDSPDTRFGSVDRFLVRRAR